LHVTLHRCEITEKRIEKTLALFRSQKGNMSADWYARFCASSDPQFKFMDDNTRDETRRTLPKTNERDRHNQPLPANIIGRHFGTSTRHDHTAQ
jgi:hypothetical protein